MTELAEDKYYIFDRLKDGPVLAVYTGKPLDFHFDEEDPQTPERRAALYSQIEEDLGYRFRAVKRCLRQVHGDRVVCVTEENLSQEIPEADGLVTDLPGVALEIRTADCQSVFLYDPVRRVIANVHSGWRGTLQEISVRAAGLMQQNYGCRPEDIEAYVNPSILGCCFEVEGDVAGLFRDRLAAEGRSVDAYCREDRILNGKQKYLMDTAAITRDDLISAGLSADRIFLSGICTKCGGERYHSYRREGREAGRAGALICIR